MEILRDLDALICDWDDVISDTHTQVLKRIERFARSSQLPIPHQDRIRLAWGLPVDKMVCSFWPHSRPDTLVRRYRAFEPKFTTTPFRGVELALRSLREMELRLGVVSSAPREAIRRMIATFMDFPLDTPNEVFDFIHAAEDCHPHHKPNPEVFDKAFEYLSSLGIKDDRVAYVGDSLGDYQAAKARGIIFLAVTSGFTSWEEFTSVGVPENRIFTDLARMTEAIYRARA